MPTLRQKFSTTLIPLNLVALSLLALQIPHSANALSSPNPYSSAGPYLHYPHPETRRGHAFMPDDPDNLVRLDFSSIVVPEEGTNPAPAWARHPLAKPLPKQQQPVGRRDVISVSNVPFPPAAYIDVNNLTTIAMLAQAAVARMQTWYTAGQYEWTGWWQIPVLGIAYANLDLALGNRGNELLIKDLMSENAGLGYMIDKYIDDQSWWAMFGLRAYQNYQNDTWMEAMKNISYNNTLYWDDTCGGGVLWLTYKPQIKNTITNGLYFSILARLFRFTGDYQYFQYAMNTLNWWLGWAFETSTGRVYDTITGPDCNVTGLETWTYNSGAFLYGLADLFYATNNATLLDLGRTIAYAAIRDFSLEDTGVLQESCEHDPQPDPSLPPGCQQDELVFKGILVMGMAELYLARPDSNIYNFINTQLLSNVFNNIDSTFLFGEWWYGPWNETTAGPKTQISVLCLISAAALVNADHLSRAGHNVTVNVLGQVAVPSNTTSGLGDAGSTARSTTGASSASSRVSIEWNAAWTVGAVVGTMLLGGVGVLVQ